MSRSQAYWEAKARYQKEKRKLISADVPKETGERYQAYVAAIGGSMSSLIRQAVDEFIARHSGEIAETNTVGEKIPIEDKAEHSSQQITGEELKLLTIFKSLPPKTQKNLLKFLESLQD